jgi:hypothetical protein
MPGGYHNQARMSVANTGTGTFTLSSAIQNFNSFATVGVGDQEVVPYGMIDTSINASEQGWGVYSVSGTTLTRNVFTSTNGNNAVSISSQAQVFIDPSVADFIQLSLIAHTNLGGL